MHTEERTMGGPIQKYRSDIYTERTIRHVYRERDPSSIQRAPTTVYRKKNASSIPKETIPHLYRRNVTRHVYRENDPSLIQRDITPSLYTERAKLGFKRSDNWLNFRDNNGSMPPVMATGKNYWSEMLFSDSWYWWFSFEVWGLFLLRRKRPQWSLLTASHWTNTALPNLLLIQ